jgi:hypothetical protein
MDLVCDKVHVSYWINSLSNVGNRDNRINFWGVLSTNSAEMFSYTLRHTL